MEQNLNVDLVNQPDITCEKCQNMIFLPAVRIKKISALMSPTGKETIAPVQVFACANCGEIWSPYKLDKDEPTEPPKPNIITP